MNCYVEIGVKINSVPSLLKDSWNKGGGVKGFMKEGGGVKGFMKEGGS